MDLKILYKYIANKCSVKEVDTFFSWIQKDGDNSEFINNYWNQMELINSEDEEKSRQRLDRIHHQINLNNNKSNQAKVRSIVNNVSLRTFIYRAAVILLIPILTLFFYTRYFQDDIISSRLSEQKNVLMSPAGSRTFTELSDGSKIWLNNNSKLIYPQHFSEDKRVVELVGEAYFEVASNKKKPFIVETNGIAVKAVGTAFNVKAYSEDKNIETTLIEGKVIMLKGTAEENIQVCEMNPGQHFAYNDQTAKYSLTETEIAKYVSWKEGKLIFVDDRLDDVVQELSRWYNVKITLADPGLEKLTYTATFVDESLTQVLEMLEFVTPIKYQLMEREKQDDGTYSTREIKIYKKE